MANLLYREALIELATEAIAEAGLARLSFCSEFPVKRRDKNGNPFFEVLSHAPGDANLGLLNRQGVVLQDHDPKMEIGEVVKNSARVDADKKTRADIRIFDTTWKRRVAANQSMGVSVGYVTLSEVGREIGADGIPTIRFSFRPYEVSLLTVEPADPGVGINRSKNNFMTKKSSLENLLELALSGSRKTENEFTREALHEYSLEAIIQSQINGAHIPRARTFEKEIHDAVEKTLPWMSTNGACIPFGALSLQRDMQANVFGAGGAAVTSDMHPAIDLLYNRVVAIALGATVVPGLRGNFQAPRITSPASAGVVSEIAPAAQTGLTLDQQELTPCRATMQIPVSLQLLKQTGGSAEQIIRMGIRKALGVLVDRLTLFGQGGNSEPLGILNTPGIGSVTFGGAATWPNVLLFEQNISLENTDEENLGWALSPTTRNKWKQASRIAATNYPSMIMEGGNVNDYPALTSNQLSGQNQSIFGNWPDVYILIWGEGIDLMIDPVTQAANGKALITGHIWFNVLASHPQSFCVSADSAAQ